MKLRMTLRSPEGTVIHTYDKDLERQELMPHQRGALALLNWHGESQGNPGVVVHQSGTASITYELVDV